MKPIHEQEWRPSGRGAVEVWDHGAPEKHGRIVAATGTVVGDAELERRLSAVPDMARALLKTVGNHDEDCACLACSALLKVGVLP